MINLKSNSRKKASAALNGNTGYGL